MASSAGSISVAQSESVSVNDVGNTGIQLTVNNAGRGDMLTVALQSLSGPSQGEGSVELASGSGARYYDVRVAGTANPESVATVCFTDASFTSSTQLAYWNSGWFLLASNASGKTVCAEVPLGELGGTNFVASAGFVGDKSPAGGSSSLLGSPAIVFVMAALVTLSVLVSAAYLASRRTTKGK